MNRYTDRHDEASSRFFFFCNFANAPKNARVIGEALYLTNTGYYDNNYTKKGHKREITFKWKSVKFLPLPRSHSEHIRI